MAGRIAVPSHTVKRWLRSAGQNNRTPLQQQHKQFQPTLLRQILHCRGQRLTWLASFRKRRC